MARPARKRTSRRTPSTRRTWSVAGAKASLSEVLHRAQSDGPQLISRRGDVVAVVVSVADWEKRSERPGEFLEFLMRSPLRGSEVEFERLDEKPREVDF